MKAVVTTGGRVDAEYAAAAGIDIKALAPIGDATMLDRIIEALRGAGIDRIAVVGGSAVREACAARVERFIEEGDSGIENVRRALSAWPEDGDALVYSTSDMPYVNDSAVRDFVSRVPEKTIAISLTEHDAFVRRFPQAPPFGITLAGERVVNGGCFLLPPDSTTAVVDYATKLFEARKAPWKMVGMVQPMALIKFAIGRLSVADVERVAHRIVGFPSLGVRNCAPELAYDADTATEYCYACEHP
ncbi:MAG TPA: NTP transferase domain-containing protein [Candidatus Tumulicola sp.]